MDVDDNKVNEGSPGTTILCVDNGSDNNNNNNDHHAALSNVSTGKEGPGDNYNDCATTNNNNNNDNNTNNNDRTNNHNDSDNNTNNNDSTNNHNDSDNNHNRLDYKTTTDYTNKNDNNTSNNDSTNDNDDDDDDNRLDYRTATNYVNDLGINYADQRQTESTIGTRGTRVLPYDSNSNSVETSKTEKGMTRPDQDHQSPVTVDVVNPNSDNPHPDHPSARICQESNCGEETISATGLPAANAANVDNLQNSDSSRGVRFASDTNYAITTVSEEVSVESNGGGRGGGEESVGLQNDSNSIDGEQKENNCESGNIISKDLANSVHKDELDSTSKGNDSSSGPVTNDQSLINDGEVDHESGGCDYVGLKGGESDVQINIVEDKDLIEDANSAYNRGAEGKVRQSSTSSIDSEKVSAFVSEITNKALESYRDEIVQLQRNEENSLSEEQKERNSKDQEDNLSGTIENGGEEFPTSVNEDAAQVNDLSPPIIEAHQGQSKECHGTVGEENTVCVNSSSKLDLDSEQLNTPKDDEDIEYNNSPLQEKHITENQNITSEHRRQEGVQQQQQQQLQSSSNNEEDLLATDDFNNQSDFTAPVDHHHHQQQLLFTQSTADQNSYREDPNPNDSLSSSPLPPLPPSPPPLASSPLMMMMNDEDCRPRTRPKSSHPRRRGQQDSTAVQFADDKHDILTNGYEHDEEDSFIRTPSPIKRSPSPNDNIRSPSPNVRSTSPTKRSTSPTKRSTSPTKRSTSPTKRSTSPTKRAQSPSVRSPSPGGLPHHNTSGDDVVDTNEELNNNDGDRSGVTEHIFHIENVNVNHASENDDTNTNIITISPPSSDEGADNSNNSSLNGGDVPLISPGSVPGDWGCDPDGGHSSTTPSSKSPCNDRLSRIADAADNIAGMQDDLQNMFREAKEILTHYQSQLNNQSIVKFSQVVPGIYLIIEAKEILTHYQSQLNSQSIAEFSQEAPEFTQAFSSLSDAYRVCESVTGNIDQQLHDIRAATSEICDLITHKATNEDLADFMQGKDSNGGDMESIEQEASCKEQQARLQELKAITAKAAAQAQAALELAAQAEVKATEADVAAANARKEAEIAMRKIEDAKIAAEEKRRKDEEEARRVTKENAKRKAEEEKRRKEEDERRIAKEAEARGTSKEEERRRYLEEKKRLEAERKNPNNWPRYIYSIDGGDWNPGVGLILRAQQGCLDMDDLEITLVDQMDSCFPLGENEELISNIMCLRPVDSEKSYKFEEPMSVSIPHCSPRIPPGREPVVKLMNLEGKMSTLNTHDLIFDDIKELKFVEVRLRQFGTMAVYLRSKKEHLTLNKMGGKVMSSVDSRVTITSCENAFRTHADLTMEVQPVDQNLVLELKTKKPDPCGSLMATSPIVSVQMAAQFHKPLTVTLPCPANPALRPRRPQTATPRLAPPPPPPPKEKQDPKDRPLSARMFQTKEEPETDEVHLLRKDGGGSWMRADGVILNHTKKKDIVSFNMVNPFNKLVLIRTKAGLSNSHVERILGHVIVALTFKPVSVIMRQKSSDPNRVTVTCAQSTNVERVIKSLGEEGYDHGPKPSPDILLTEGQRLALRFRGNLLLTDDKFSRENFKFCNHIPFRLDFTVSEHDKYAQKGFDSYRGFSQIFTKGKVRRPSVAGDDRDRATGQRLKDEYVDGDILVCEHLIIIPKPDPETPRPLNITPVTLSSEGVVNDEMLRFLSTHLQNNDWKRLAAQLNVRRSRIQAILRLVCVVNDEMLRFLSTHLQNNDWKRLAAQLNVRRSRIQAILRQNINSGTSQTVYDILVTWSKRLPRAVNRTDILCKNLSSVGRDDLAEELRVRDEEHRQAKHVKARESYLRKAFVAIARNPLAVTQWKHLARYLEVDDDEIHRIESTHASCQESCLATLIRWKELRGEEATIPLLATKLRRCRYRRLAREIEDIR